MQQRLFAVGFFQKTSHPDSPMWGFSICILPMRDLSREILRFCLCFCSLPASCPELIVCLQMMSSWLKFLISLLPRALGISSSIDICIMHTGFISYHSASYFNYLNLTVNESGSQEQWHSRKKIGFRNSILEWGCRTILTPPPSPLPPPPTSPLRPVHCTGNCGPGVLPSPNKVTFWSRAAEFFRTTVLSCRAAHLHQLQKHCAALHWQGMFDTIQRCLAHICTIVFHTYEDAVVNDRTRLIKSVTVFKVTLSLPRPSPYFEQVLKIQPPSYGRWP